MGTRSNGAIACGADAAMDADVAVELSGEKPLPPPSSVRVGLLEDHPIVRVATRQLIEKTLGWSVVAEWGDAASFLVEAEGCPLDVLVLDLALGRDDGLAVLATSGCRVGHVIVVSMHDTPLHRSRARIAGASAFVTKHDPLDVLIEALRAVDPRLPRSERVVADCGGAGRQGGGLLTARETDVLALILAGRSVTQIVDQFGVSVKTIYVHRENLMRKLGAARPSEIAARAEALALR